MEQSDVLRHVLDVLESQQIIYMVVGSFASSVLGEARLTLDIDIVIDVTPEQIDRLCQAFPDSEYYVSAEAARKALAQGLQFNVLHYLSGNKIDFMIARRDDWGRMQLARRREEVIIPGRNGFLAAPEDIILGKMIYYQEGRHEKHLRDIAAMLRISGHEIDREYIADWSKRLGLDDVWQAILSRADHAAE